MKRDGHGDTRRSRLRPGSTLRLEIDLSNFVCFEARMTAHDVGELFDMLMSEAAGDPVGPASKPWTQHVFDSRDEYCVVRGGFGRAALPLAVRQEVFERDGRRCRYCDRAITWADYHCDHVEPVSLGGSDRPSNLAAACVACNLAKAAKPLEAWQR